jgi:hypothetical protein
MRARSLFAALGSLAMLALFVILSEGRPARADNATVLRGTGNFDTSVVRTAQTLMPDCVSLVTRVGTSSFTGLIQGQGSYSSQALRDACGSVQGTNRGTLIIDPATIGNRTGSLELTFEGVFEGDATSSTGARSRQHWRLNGLTGSLAGATGEGESVGLALTTASSVTYYFEIRLPNGT